MRQRLYFVWVGTAIILLALVGVIQVMRVDGFYKLFPARGQEVAPIKTMSTDQIPSGQEVHVTLVTDKEDPILNNIAQALTYAKVPFSYRTPLEAMNVTPSPYHILVITDNILPYEATERFVKQGGRLFVAQRFTDKRWNSLVGIEENNGYFENNAYGIEIQKPLFPGYETIVDTQGSIPNSMMDVTLSNQAELYMTAENIPMLWTHEYEKGKVVYWNATFLVTKFTRGLITQSMGLATPQFVSGQVATKVMFIDDFPAPFPAGFTDVITKDYDMTTQAFFEKIWWPDMKRIAEEAGLLYTNMFIGTYRNDDMVTSEQLISDMRHQMIFFGRDSQRRGDELGYHGYNHQPLVTSREPMDTELQYIPWRDQQHMESSIIKAKQLFSYYFPDEILRSYVPPSNVLNETGIHALKQAMPTIQVIGSLYDGGDGKGVFEQEFEGDAFYKDLFHFPRISSGYGQAPFEMLAITDAVANFGMFSHFIHPDDLLDIDRAHKAGWKPMRKGLTELMYHMNHMYPYLREYQAFYAAEKMKQYSKANLYVHYSEDQITISGKGLVNPCDVFVRVEKGTLVEGKFAGYHVTKYMDGLYHVQVTKPLISIPVKEVK
ncbi:DUF2194 domain-containing protein [Ectobacillus antri]|jgi:hypothetical protein|uniref:DUF2194 domain-containing protein n=1 Tax=Ectobacillus antri TaxID=2486280 RepID=A0ABT6H9I4_9BACI|nr:DUF2194 domain-containing protein [Ectobacillus antri]MDG4658290.1 DUF2194 domain-containing protein [Ectobacillus antri]MDG5755543.1 DUF2194 domain-containing protein [Ectobacillus antri]